jgi:DNA-binding transcriptional MerR regulator
MESSTDDTMRIGELSKRTDVSVPLIKYYLREGLLAAGERAGAPNQAAYGTVHLRRLRLLRALVEEGGLSTASIKQVMATVDGPDPLVAALGAVQDAVTPASSLSETAETREAGITIAGLVEKLGWQVSPANPGWQSAVRVLGACRRLGHTELDTLLEPYAEAMSAVARQEAAALIDDSDRDGSVEGAVLAVVLGTSLLAALRTMAQEDASVRYLAPTRARAEDVDHQTETTTQEQS